MGRSLDHDRRPDRSGRLSSVAVDGVVREKLVRLGVKLGQRTAAYRSTAGSAMDVMAADWDNLVILDACRYDLFERHRDLPGTLRKVRSPGSHSREFIEHNFLGGEHHDAVYVSANPYAATVDDGVFHATVDLFATEWDEDVLTVRPEAVVEATLAANREYPDKRLVAHFMQPHYPFLGEIGRSMETGGVTGHGVGREGKTDQRRPSIWSLLDRGAADLDPERVWEAYAENLRLVQRHVSDLLASLDGKTVVTSDHGNLFGERLRPLPVAKYGHPPGLRLPALLEVPWLEVPCESRRSIERSPPEASESTADELVERRLADLGYRT